MNGNPSPCFRVIVIGGGPIGLTAAHSLYLAGIDFVVLERRDNIVEDKGASLVIHPHTMRVMHQFGLLEALKGIGGELNRHLSFTSDGRIFKEGTRYQRMKENHGCGPFVFHRAELIKVLHDGLPAAVKQNVLTGKKVINIATDEAGVTVSCSGGESYRGSIVIGADGVHSTTRRLMRALALKEDPSREWDPENPYTSTFQLLFGAFLAPSESGLGYDVQSRDKCIMYLSGPEKAWVFLYKKLPKPTTQRITYTDQDVEELAAEFAEYPLTEKVKVKDVWPGRLGAGMTNLEEGIVKHWSLGRIVLVGDSCHKFTTHVGLGVNNGVQDVVTLCNGLRKAINANLKDQPDMSTLQQVFRKYEAARKSSLSSLYADFSHSGLETRMHTWVNPFYYVLSRWLSVPKVIEDITMGTIISPEFCKGAILDYVEAEEPLRGKMSWWHPMVTVRRG